jgi:hypothetical protein
VLSRWSMMSSERPATPLAVKQWKVALILNYTRYHSTA